MSVKEKVFGEVRYFTYHLYFPDGDMWTNQIPFVHDLQFELKNSRWRNDPIRCGEILRHGETHWKYQNGVTHRVVIESIQRPCNWGVKRGKKR